MKKLLALIVALLMMLTFAACDDNEKKPAATTPAATTTTGGTTEPDGTTDPDGTTVPGGTTDPNGTTVPGDTTDPDGTTTPDGTTVPGGTTAPDGTTTPGGTAKPPVTTDPKPDPEPDEGVTYTGMSGAAEMEVTILDGKGSLTQFEKEKMPADMIEQLGLNGTVIGVMEMRIEFSSATVSNGILTLFDAAPKAYQSTTFEGTAADAYVTMAKAQYKAMYEAGEIEKAEYDMYMALLNGEEIAMSDEGYGLTNMTAKFKLNDANKTCLAISSSHEDEDGKYSWECEYTADGKATKETYYNLGYYDYVEVSTYYPDGKTKKTFEEYELFINNETGEYVLGDLKGKYEYREDGTTKFNTYYYYDGSYSVTEYDENEEALKETEYDKDGNVTGYKTFVYTDDSGVIKEYEGDKLVKETYKKPVYVEEYDHTEWVTVKTVTYHENGNRTETTYFEDDIYNPDVKSEIVYDAEGNVVRKTEYNEDGSYTRVYESDGMIVTDYCNRYGTILKTTFTFTNGTTVTVFERDEYDFDKILIDHQSSGTESGIDEVLVIKYEYYDGTYNVKTESCIRYSAPDGEILDEWTVEYDENGNEIDDGGDVTPPVDGGDDLPPEEDEKFTGTQTEETDDGLVWTYDIVEDEIVKETVTFTNGTTIVTFEYDDLGRVKYGCGYGVGENDELVSLWISEYTYVGDTDEIDSEKNTEYSVPDGEILYEGYNSAYEGYYEYEYAPDGTLAKEYHYIPEDLYLSITTYYEDGETKKTWERYELRYNEETEELEIGDLRVLVEYDENGKEDTRTFYEPDGTTIVITYDENEDEVGRIEYDAEGNVVNDISYEYEEDGYWEIYFWQYEYDNGGTYKRKDWYSYETGERDYSWEYARCQELDQYGYLTGRIVEWSYTYVEYYPGGYDREYQTTYYAETSHYSEKDAFMQYIEYWENGNWKCNYMEWVDGSNNNELLGYMGNKNDEEYGQPYTEEYYDLDENLVMIGWYIIDNDFDNKCEMCFDYWDYYEDGVLVRREKYYHDEYCQNWVQYVTYYDADGNVTSTIEYDADGNVVE
ncbi:MAG: hypothetical protein IJ404_04885 [Clostridia bacterium]|nr:hypothetical protein [Clostridia bacterium]